MSTPALECPRCRTSLSQDPDRLTCAGCGASYPIATDVPVLLPEALSGQQLSQTGYFDAEFRTYEAYRAANWRLSFNSRIFAALRLYEDGGPYLDVGVGGSGVTVIEAARSGVEATGCDLSVEGVVQARRFAEREGVAGRTTFVACAAEALPFADGAFRCASAVAVLEHLDDDALGARELARVVRPGGLVWVTVPNTYRNIPLALWPVYYVHDRRLGHKRHYGAARLHALMTSAGFRTVATRYSGHRVKVLQLAMDRLPFSDTRRSSIWWKLEERDLRAEGRSSGALQISGVFERV